MIYIIFIMPLLQISIGFLMYKYPPKKINHFIGYRTFKSMQNEKVWIFSNKYCGKLWLKMGIIILLLTIILFFFNYFKIIILTEDILTIVELIQVTTMLLSIFIVESKIKD